jgi:hypothetical protein
MIRLAGRIAAIAAILLLVAAEPGAAAKEAEPMQDVPGDMSLQSGLAASRRLELRALRLLDDPRVRKAKEDGERRLAESISAIDPDSKARFAPAAREIALLAVLHAVNTDPERPSLLYAELPPRSIGGAEIAGSRGLDDNPDTVYRFATVDGRSHFVISGKVRPNRPVVNEFSVLTDDWVTVGNISGKDLAVGPDGTFSITIDPDPAAGRPNHIQTRDGASYLVIRDTLADWSRDKPNLLSIRRVEPPTAPAPDDAALAEVAARYVRKWFDKTVELHAMAFGQPANYFPQPEIRKTMGMLVTQAYSVGHFALRPDQALVLTLRTGGAGYAVVPATNIWGLTNDPVHHSASLNTTQAVRDPDGAYTFVLSARDPQVANWIGPEGMTQGFLFLRWAAIDPHHPADDKPSISAKVVPMSDLAASLPAMLPRVDAAARRRQLAARAEAYEQRWLEP